MTFNEYILRRKVTRENQNKQNGGKKIRKGLLEPDNLDLNLNRFHSKKSL